MPHSPFLTPQFPFCSLPETGRTFPAGPVSAAGGGRRGLRPAQDREQGFPRLEGTVFTIRVSPFFCKNGCGHKVVESGKDTSYNRAEKRGLAEKMVTKTVTIRCLHCGSEQVSRNGHNKAGKQRYLCNNPECQHRSFVEEYTNRAWDFSKEETSV